MPAWLSFALLSALAASFVGILGKVGMKEVDSNLATAVRSIVMTIFLVIVAQVMGVWSKVGDISSKSWAMITASGIAGALSWLFMFHALKLGQASKVAPIDKLSMPLAVILAVILLGERPSGLNWLGIALIVAGALLAALPSK